MVELRTSLLELHRAIIAFERAAQERLSGQLTAAAFLRMLLEDGAYAWLRPLSALIARMDDEEAAPVTAEEVRALLRPRSTGTPFEQRYAWLMDRSADVAYAHGMVMRALNAQRREMAAYAARG